MRVDPGLLRTVPARSAHGVAPNLLPSRAPKAHRFGLTLGQHARLAARADLRRAANSVVLSGRTVTSPKCCGKRRVTPGVDADKIRVVEDQFDAGVFLRFSGGGTLCAFRSLRAGRSVRGMAGVPDD